MTKQRDEIRNSLPARLGGKPRQLLAAGTEVRGRIRKLSSRSKCQTERQGQCQEPDTWREAKFGSFKWSQRTVVLQMQVAS